MTLSQSLKLESNSGSIVELCHFNSAIDMPPFQYFSDLGMQCHFCCIEQDYMTMTTLVESVILCLIAHLKLFCFSLFTCTNMLCFNTFQVRLWEWKHGSSIRILLNDSKWSIVCFCQHFKQKFFCYDSHKIWGSLFCWLHLWKRRWVIVNFFWSFLNLRNFHNLVDLF